MKQLLIAILLGAVLGFAVHGLAVQLMNNLVVWKIVVHSCLIVLSGAGVIYLLLRGWRRGK